MVFWEALESVKNHEEVAAHSILNIQRKIKEYALKEKVISFFNTRFALHTGNVVIGNIGSKERFNYNIIGNNVNICSRLESLNKRYGTSAILSQETKKKLGSDFVTRPLDCVRLKGINTPIKVFELCGYAVDNLISFLDDYLYCNSLFYNKNWSKVLQEFTKLKTSYPKEPVIIYYCELTSFFIETDYDSPDDLILDLQEK